MRLTLLPDWLIYAGALATLVAAADLRRLHADAPAAPPPAPGMADLPLSPLSPFNAAKVFKLLAGGRMATTFAVAIKASG